MSQAFFKCEFAQNTEIYPIRWNLRGVMNRKKPICGISAPPAILNSKLITHNSFFLTYSRQPSFSLLESPFYLFDHQSLKLLKPVKLLF